MLNSPSERNELAPLNGTSPNGTLPNGAALNGAAPNGAHPIPATPSPAPHSAGADTLDLGAILKALWRRKGLLLSIWALVVLAGTALTLRQRSVYEATCSILISSPSESAPAVGDSLRSLLSASQPRSVGTQIAIMRSYPVQRATLKRLPPEQQPGAKEWNTLDVRPQRDSEAIDIVAQSYDPETAANLANALSDEYRAQSQEQNRQQILAGTREVSAQLEGARKRLNLADNAIKNYKQSHGTVNFDEESSARLGQINQIEIAIRDAEAEREASIAQVRALGSQIAGQPRIQVTPDRIVRSPKLEALRTQLTQLDLQRINTARRYRTGSPELRLIDDQRADVQAQLQNATKTEVSSWTRNVNPLVQSATQDMARAQIAIASASARITALRGAQKQARAQESLLPEREFQLKQLENDQTALQQTYQLLNQKYQSLLVSEGARLTTARPLAPAEAPLKPVRPRRMLNLAMSVLLGAFLATLIALLADHLDDRVRSAQSAQNAARLPVLAQIPAGSNLGATLIQSQFTSHQALESFRLLRTSLLLPGANGVSTLPLSILVAGAGAGENAAGCALNLALAIAQSGKSVILLDADLRLAATRHPGLSSGHSELGLVQERGLSELLRGQIAVEAALQPTGVPNLRFIGPGGDLDGATDLLDSDAARGILQSVMARAECVVLSGPPVLGGADTPILATIAQCGLLVVSSDRSQSSEIAQAREILARTGISLPGLILDNVKVA